MLNHQASKGPRGRWRLPAACTAVTTGSFGIVCASAGALRVIAGLCLVGALAGTLWLAARARFRAIVPAIGLTLAFLVLAGLALAAVHALSTVPTALAIGAVTVPAAWASVWYPAPGRAERQARRPQPGSLAVAGVMVFAVAAVVGVHYAAASATADGDGASSLAVWAYPSGDQLHVGAEQPAGHGAASLRIVVIQAGVTEASWSNIRLTPGRPWEAPALTLTGNGPVRVIALYARTVVASLSASPS